MNIKNYLKASLAVFVFIFFFEWVFHGIFLEGIYTQTQHLWRAKEDCIFWAMLAGQLMFPFVFGWIFLGGYEQKGVSEGMRFGILVGLLFIPSNLVFYAVQPLPLALIFFWSIGGLLEMALCGAIFAAAYRS